MSKNTKKLLTTTVVASALLVGGSNGVIHADQTNDQPTDNEQKPKVLQVPKQTNKVTLKSSPQKQAQEIPATPAPKPAVAAPVAKAPAVKVTPKKVQPVVKNQEAQPKTQFTAYAADQASIMVSPYIKTTLAPNGKTGNGRCNFN